MIVNESKMGVNGQKVHLLPNRSPFCAKGDKMEQKATQTHILRKKGNNNDENGAKTTEKETVMNKSVQSLKAEQDKLVEDRNIVKEAKKVGVIVPKPKKVVSKPKTSNPKGVTTMSPRIKAE